MKQILLLAIMFVMSVNFTIAQRHGTMKVRGVDCSYDTLIYRTIGPGVTYTLFQFKDMYIGGSVPYMMRTHLFTIDMTNPYNRLSPYMAEDTYYECNTQKKEVERQKKAGKKPFASCNGIGFIQVPTSPKEPNQYMETMSHLVCDGLIRYDNNSKNVRYYNDAQNKGHVDYLTMQARVISSRGDVAEIGQINHYRDFVRDKNQLALFCNDMPKARDTNPYDGIEVFLNGDPIRVGINKLQVAYSNSGCGKSTEKGQHVITGVGSEMERFLNSLEPGETVTIDIGYVDATGNSVVANNSFTAFIANCIRDGVAFGDPRNNVAYSATGVSKDGNTVYIADLEISAYSNAPLRCLEDFMINVGVWNACYNDGGPSSEMTVDGEFVTNNSIGNGFSGRYCPNGLMLYSTAPDDNEVVSVECEDNSLRKLELGDSFRLKLFGYNKYGEMIENNAFNNAAVEIDYPKELGFLSSTGYFTAAKAGLGIITVSVKGHGVQLQIPVNIGSQKGLFFAPSKVFTGEGRPVKVDVKYFAGTEITDVDPSQVTWTVDDQYVVASCDNGKIVPFMDGYATVTATYQDVTGTVSVEVENLEVEGTESIELTDKVGSISDMNLHLPSVPRSIYIETVARDQDPVVLKYTTGEKEREAELVNKGVGVTSGSTITLDYDAADAYPVTIKSLSPLNTELRHLTAIYTDNPSGIEDVYPDANGKYPGANGQQLGVTNQFRLAISGGHLILTNCSDATDVTITAYTFAGTRLAELQTHLPVSGTCFLDVPLTEPLILRVSTTSAAQVFKLVTITQ